MLHLAVETAFDDLLASWRAHKHNQEVEVAVTELAASRDRLDKARNRMHQLRTAIYPEEIELESIIESVWCESLDVVVHLRWVDRDPVRPGCLACACGELVPIDWDAASSRTV